MFKLFLYIFVLIFLALCDIVLFFYHSSVLALLGFPFNISEPCVRVPWMRCERLLLVSPSLLQFLQVSVDQRTCLCWLWLKEVLSHWCVSPVAYRPQALPGGRTVSVCVFVRDRKMQSANKSKINLIYAFVLYTEYCVGDMFEHICVCPRFWAQIRPKVEGFVRRSPAADL